MVFSILKEPHSAAFRVQTSRARKQVIHGIVRVRRHGGTTAGGRGGNAKDVTPRRPHNGFENYSKKIIKIDVKNGLP